MTGRLIYTVVLNTGSRAIQAQHGNTLNFVLSREDATMIDCTHTSSSVNVEIGEPLAADLPYNTDVTCRLYLPLTSTETAGASIDPINVKATFTASPPAREFFVPDVDTSTVPVATMSSPVGAGVFSAGVSGTAFYDSGELSVSLTLKLVTYSSAYYFSMPTCVRFTRRKQYAKITGCSVQIHMFWAKSNPSYITIMHPFAKAKTLEQP